MQLGEAALVTMIPEWEHDKDNCPFCNAATLAEEITNDLTDSYDEDKDPGKNAESLVPHEQFGTIDQGVRFKNDASKLGKALGGRPEDCKVNVPLRGATGRVTAGTKQPLPVTCAAHHLIPGNAALKASSILELLRVDGPGEGNIGYNVNKATNGVWLPGNYALRGKWSGTLQGGVDRLDYVRSCMVKYGQFHDSHTKYSEEVVKALDAIAGKYNSLLASTCPSCENDDKAKDAKVSLFLLVGRIDWLSNTLRGYVQHYDSTVGIQAHWKRNLLVSDTYGLAAVDDLESIADAPPPARRRTI